MRVKNSLRIVKRVLLTLLIIFTLFIASLWAVETYKRINFDEQPVGEMIDIGGYKIHAKINRGKGATVVFESGLDPSGHLGWYKVEALFDENINMFSYDRSGYIWSERGTRQRSLHNMALELKLALEEANMQKPYILVGHSLGGLIMQQFAFDYPQLVKGLVLVDSSHPKQFDEMSDELLKYDKIPNPSIYKTMASLGILRKMSRSFYSGVDEESNLYKLMPHMIHRGLGTFLEENNHFEAMLKEAGNLESLGDMPVLILTGTDKERYSMLPEELKVEAREVWEGLQRDYLDLSSDSKQILAKESGHNIHIDEANLVYEAINSIQRK